LAPRAAGLGETIAPLSAGTRLRRLALTRLEPAGTGFFSRTGVVPRCLGATRPRRLRRAPAPHGNPRSGASRSSPRTIATGPRAPQSGGR